MHPDFCAYNNKKVVIFVGFKGTMGRNEMKHNSFDAFKLHISP